MVLFSGIKLASFFELRPWTQRMERTVTGIHLTWLKYMLKNELLTETKEGADPLAFGPSPGKLVKKDGEEGDAPTTVRT